MDKTFCWHFPVFMIWEGQSDLFRADPYIVWVNIYHMQLICFCVCFQKSTCHKLLALSHWQLNLHCCRQTPHCMESIILYRELQPTLRHMAMAYTYIIRLHDNDDIQCIICLYYIMYVLTDIQWQCSQACVASWMNWPWTVLLIGKIKFELKLI